MSNILLEVLPSDVVKYVIADYLLPSQENMKVKFNDVVQEIKQTGDFAMKQSFLYNTISEQILRQTRINYKIRRFKILIKPHVKEYSIDATERCYHISKDIKWNNIKLKPIPKLTILQRFKKALKKRKWKIINYIYSRRGGE